MCGIIQILFPSVHAFITPILCVACLKFRAHVFQVENHDTVEMGGTAEVKWISHLLDLSPDWLKQALTQKVTVSDPFKTSYSITWF